MFGGMTSYPLGVIRDPLCVVKAILGNRAPTNDASVILETLACKLMQTEENQHHVR